MTANETTTATAINTTKVANVTDTKRNLVAEFRDFHAALIAHEKGTAILSATEIRDITSKMAAISHELGELNTTGPKKSKKAPSSTPSQGKPAKPLRADIARPTGLLDL